MRPKGHLLKKERQTSLNSGNSLSSLSKNYAPVILIV